MVARFVRDEEAAGSNPVSPTILKLPHPSLSSGDAVFSVLSGLPRCHYIVHEFVVKNTAYSVAEQRVTITSIVIKNHHGIVVAGQGQGSHPIGAAPVDIVDVGGSGSMDIGRTFLPIHAQEQASCARLVPWLAPWRILPFFPELALDNPVLVPYTCDFRKRTFLFLCETVHICLVKPPAYLFPSSPSGAENRLLIQGPRFVAI